MAFLRFLVLAAALVSAPLARADTFLIMVEEAGCLWCARFNSEIAETYPKTTEGRSAPLRRHDIHDGAPSGVVLGARLRFTPTFVLVSDGVEIGRIEGYPGEDFFWGLLGRMLSDAGIVPAPAT